MSSPSKRVDPQTLITESQAPLDLPNPAALEMKAEEFQQWRHHPVTQCFLLFLAHHSLSFQREMLDRWRAGTLKPVEEQDLRGRVNCLEELCALNLADIQRFYGKEPDSKTGQQSEPNGRAPRGVQGAGS